MGKLSKLKQKKAEEEIKKANYQRILKETKYKLNQPLKIYENILNGKTHQEMIPEGSGYERLCKVLQNDWNNAKSRKYNDKGKLMNLFVKLAKNNALFIAEDPAVMNGLCAAVEKSENWLCDPDHWKPNSYNYRKAFSSLIRHLFARYAVPVFMDNAFYEKNPAYLKWFVYLGNGFNIRKMKDLPLNLTNRMAHYFTKAPDELNILEALRYGQVLGLGGSHLLALQLLSSRLGREFENQEFWESVIRFFIRQTNLKNKSVAPIVDYIWSQKFEEQQIVRGNGEVEILKPPHPGFSMKGRSLESLLGAVERWHLELQKKRKAERYQWKPVQIDDFVHTEGFGHTQKTYRIEQLRTYGELYKEGKLMNHCVLTYAYDCSKGQCSIWSMTVESAFAMKERLLTIELDRNGRVVQARKNFNDPPTEEEIFILWKWALRNGLHITNWIA